MSGQLLESSQENNVERTRAEEQSSHSPKQIRCLVDEIAIKRTNAQISGMEHFKWDTSN